MRHLPKSLVAVFALTARSITTMPAIATRIPAMEDIRGDTSLREKPIQVHAARTSAPRIEIISPRDIDILLLSIMICVFTLDF